MSPEQRFKDNIQLAEATLYKLLGQPKSVALSNSMEYQDLVQYARMGLWIACQTYNPKYKFQTHAINHIRWAVLDGINIDADQFSHNLNLVDRGDFITTTSFDAPVVSEADESDLTLHDTLSDPNEEDSVSTIIMRQKISEIMSILTERQRFIIRMRAEDRTYAEIAEHLGVSKQAVQKNVQNINRRVRETMGVEL